MHWAGEKCARHPLLVFCFCPCAFSSSSSNGHGSAGRVTVARTRLVAAHLSPESLPWRGLCKGPVQRDGTHLARTRRARLLLTPQTANASSFPQGQGDPWICVILWDFTRYGDQWISSSISCHVTCPLPVATVGCHVLIFPAEAVWLGGPPRGGVHPGIGSVGGTSCGIWSIGQLIHREPDLVSQDWDRFLLRHESPTSRQCGMGAGDVCPPSPSPPLPLPPQGPDCSLGRGIVHLCHKHLLSVYCSRCQGCSKKDKGSSYQRAFAGGQREEGTHGLHLCDVRW